MCGCMHMPRNALAFAFRGVNVWVYSPFLAAMAWLAVMATIM